MLGLICFKPFDKTAHIIHVRGAHDPHPNTRSIYQSSSISNTRGHTAILLFTTTRQKMGRVFFWSEWPPPLLGKPFSKDCWENILANFYELLPPILNTLKEQLLNLRTFILSIKSGPSPCFKRITVCWTIVRPGSMSYANKSVRRHPGHLPASAGTQAKSKCVQELV